MEDVGEETAECAEGREPSCGSNGMGPVKTSVMKTKSRVFTKLSTKIKPKLKAK